MNPQLKPPPQAPQPPPPPGPLRRLARLRKTYVSERELRRDRWLVVLAFVVLNILVLLVLQWLGGPAWPYVSPRNSARLGLWFELLPWLANGLPLLLAFIFRPQIAFGYIACFAGILLLGFSLFAVVVASCIVSIPVILIFPPLGLLAFFGAALVGMVWFLPKVWQGFYEWWRKP
jgi:hypothetical protein